MSSELSNAIEQYLAGGASAEQVEIVNSWYHSFDDSDIIIEAEEADLIKKIDLRLKARLLNSTGVIVESPLAAAVTVGTQRIRYAAAAAVLIFFSISAYFWHGHKQTSVTGLQFVDIKPGGNHATLRMASGLKLVLDDLPKGIVAQHGKLAVNKNGEGQIAYSGDADPQQPVGNDILSTPKGGMYFVKLSDGTGVWLNAATTIAYPQKFTGKKRQMEILSGEAYFEVAHDKSKPFFIKVKGQVIEVLGTHFDINTYQDDGYLETTLMQGSIRLNKGNDVAILKPGQMARTEEKARKGIMITNVEVENTLAWKNNLFKFDNTSLHTVMKQLERWYNIEVKFEGDVPNVHFSGGTVMNKNLSEVLKVLELYGVHFRIEGRNVTVLP